MAQTEISKLADWLEAHKAGIADRSQRLDKNRVFQVIDNLKVLNQPINTYLEMSEEHYYETESDHLFTLDAGATKLSALKDRIMINHVDGSPDENELTFHYNHENAFEGGYAVKVDLNILTYGFEVVGAAAELVSDAILKDKLSKDAVVSLGLAAACIDDWQNHK
ncbi:MAG: hypothetical protein LKF36_01790 [Lactobacillus sp.]|jgi:hypothetical protein|nr:hypothetical protein [Lactobacillus sp.]